ncbi:MAG: hypothetical protein J6K94_00775 [Ruminiclostridium sp.]|nr:hypothetical protein [Ruminiclostridium sp.]
MKKEIRTESYVKREGGLISVEDLPPQEREALAAKLKERYLNELFRGKGRIWRKGS